MTLDLLLGGSHTLRESHKLIVVPASGTYGDFDAPDDQAPAAAMGVHDDALERDSKRKSFRRHAIAADEARAKPAAKRRRMRAR